MATFSELAATAQVHLNEAFQALRALEALLGSEVAQESEQNLTPLDIHHRLLLVNRPISVGVIAGWSREERQAVAAWALAELYAASDNDEVIVPSEPAVLSAIREPVLLDTTQTSKGDSVSIMPLAPPHGYAWRDPPYDEDGAGPYVVKLSRDGEDVDVSEEPVLGTRDWEGEAQAQHEAEFNLGAADAEARAYHGGDV